jgi:hypothetical protein
LFLDFQLHPFVLSLSKDARCGQPGRHQHFLGQLSRASFDRLRMNGSLFNSKLYKTGNRIQSKLWLRAQINRQTGSTVLQPV